MPSRQSAPPGTLAGVTLFDAADAVPVPIAFVAVTVKVYAVPLVRPVTLIGDAAPPAVIPPGLEVTVKPVIALPPLLPGGVNVTDALETPAVAVPIVGAPGAVGAAVGVALFDAAEAAPVPMALVAVTVKVYAVPLVRPVTVIDDVAPLAVIPPGLEVTV